MVRRDTVNFSRLGRRGFTLIELVIVIVTLGIIAAVAIPRFTDISESSKVNATKQELVILKRAIVGNPQTTAGGEYIDRGFEGDLGFAPSNLVDLAQRPDSVSPYDPLSRLGWNGPYIDSAGGEYLTDAWDAAYVYNPGARQIMSVGGNDTIRINF